MRNYKFRGKRVDNGEWVYGSLVAGEYIMTAEQARRFDIGGWFEGQMHEVVPETVGQYTGYKDRNFVEIYEHDIVNFTELQGWYEDEGLDINNYYKHLDETVEFCNGGFYPVPSVHVYVDDPWYSTTYAEFEVTGNIHDQEA